MKTLVTLPAVKALTLCPRERALLLFLTLCLSTLLVLPATGRSQTGAQAAVACDVPAFEATTRFPVGNDPRHVAAADFNGDGRLDVAVANQGAVGVADGSVLILLGDAATVFKTGVSVNAGLNPRFLVAADFNKDGKVDLATLVWSSCCSQGAVAVLTGDGAGNFTPTGTLHAVGVNPTALAVGDFNGDGSADIAAMAANPSFGVSILLGNGAGGFGAASFQQTGGNGGEVVVADLNLDGKADLATANVNSFSVSILIGDGAGGFAAAKNISLQPSNPKAIVAGDFNLDGKPDLATADTFGVVHVLTGDGTGNFSVGPGFPALSNAHAMTRGDFNGDGKLDVAVSISGSGVSILLGDGVGGFGVARHFDGGVSPISLASGDFDLDGKTDLVTANPLSNSVEFLKGEGSGDFRAASVFRAGQSPLHAAGGDFNRDGIPDIAVANSGQNRVSVLLGTGGGQFTAGPQFVVTTAPGAVAVADFNLDGRQDLVIANSSPFFKLVVVALGDGAGGFVAVAPFEVGTNPRALAVADFDSDGDPDIAAANSDSGNVSVLLGDGTGFFTSAGDVTVGGFPFSLVQADFNRDCNPDLVVLGDNNGASLLLGDGTGKFAAPVSLSPPSGSRSAAAGDLDGDGNTDLVFAHNDPSGDGTAGAAVVLRGNGAGGFAAPASFGVGRRRQLTALADFNGDDRLDIALMNSGPTASLTASVLLNVGGGNFSQPTDFSITASPGFLLASDFNDDDSPDLLTATGGSNVTILFNACAGAGSAGRAPTVQFSAPCFGALESRGFAQVGVTRTGDLSGEATVDYFTSNGTASDVSDYTTALGRLRFAPGESDKTLRVIVTDDGFVEPSEVFQVTLAGPVGAALGAPASATVNIKDTDVSPSPNPITQEAANHGFFVRQHYADFLNREPDEDGFNFWRNEITSCGANAQCIEVKRINVSAAFFLSIEFQETGYLVYRTFKAAYGDATSPGVAGTVPVVRFREFLADTQQIGRGVQVNVGDWRQQLEDNKDAYALDFVGRQRFKTAFPETMTAAEFVSKLDQNAGSVLSTEETGQLVAALGATPSDAAKRAAVLRAVAEHATLKQREFNRAFVLMQYFGYLRRNPDDAPEPGLNFGGWRFWLSKLEEFNGNYIRAEMVKAFITSDEYRKRFGQ